MIKALIHSLFVCCAFSSYAQWLSTGTANTSTLYTNGNVGIGTTSPSNIQGWDRVLDVQGPSCCSKILTTNSGGTYRMGIYSHNSWYGGGGFVGTESNHSLFFLTNYSAKMMITPDGFVGIGTTTPSSKLVIEGVDNYIDGITIQNTAAYKNLITAFSDGINPTTGSALQFKVANNNAGGNTAVMTLKGSGNVGIGTVSPSQKLTVNGTIYGKEVKVDLLVPGPDYVFEKDYALPSLDSIQTFINHNKHLPEVPSAKEMEANGINLSEMNMLLLKKVEELTLYMIDLRKENDQMKKRLTDIENKDN